MRGEVFGRYRSSFPRPPADPPTGPHARSSTRELQALKSYLKNTYPTQLSPLFLPITKF